MLATVLSVWSNGYGFHRDELYFRMLRPAWGYVDQPALTPFLARLTAHLGDSPWQLRLPATLFAVLALVVTVLITREVVVENVIPTIVPREFVGRRARRDREEKSA